MKRRRALLAGAAVVALIVGVVGFGHTRYGKPLLARAGGCPVGGQTATPEQIESYRLKNAPALKGKVRATARPAFGFTLDRSTRAEVTAWGARVHATCAEEMGGAVVRCEHADDNIDDAFFRFDPRGVLVGVDLVHAATDGATAARIVDDLAGKIEHEAGAPSTVLGTRSGEYLQTQFRQAGAEFRFTDYAADVTATNLGDVGVVVREQYRSIPD